MRNLLYCGHNFYDLINSQIVKAGVGTAVLDMMTMVHSLQQRKKTKPANQNPHKNWISHLRWSKCFVVQNKSYHRSTVCQPWSFTTVMRHNWVRWDMDKKSKTNDTKWSRTSYSEHDLQTRLAVLAKLLNQILCVSSVAPVAVVTTKCYTIKSVMEFFTNSVMIRLVSSGTLRVYQHMCCFSFSYN